MTKERKQLYEGMYILNTTLSEEARKKAIEKLEAQIASKGGEVHKTLDWGRRRLAYEIRGKREGHYILFYFSSPTTAVKELWEEYHLNEDLMRFMTMKFEGEIPESITFKRPGGSGSNV